MTAIFVLNVSNAPCFDILGGKCLLSAQCLPTQYCKTGLLNPLIGECVEGKSEGEWCIKDSTCASKHCNYFKCKKRFTQRDGSCETSVKYLNKGFSKKFVTICQNYI